MSILSRIREKAKKERKTVVLPESEDRRTLDAIDIILNEGIAKLIVVGKESVRKSLKTKDPKDLTLIEPQTFKDTESYVAEYYEMRKAKGMTPEQAREAMLTEYVTFGAFLVRKGLADGFVAGASHTTPDVIRAALRCLSIDKTVGVASGAFLMEVPDSPYGEKGVFLFADCGVNPDPNPRQLAGIAISSAKLFEQLVGVHSRVAFLSYSSKGSAGGDMVNKMVEALKKTKEIAPDLMVDGEFQVDSAIVPEVAKIKCAASAVAGRANVLIFPDLNSGNISYKIVQRLAKARAVGPLLMGFTRPCSDLSRGCDAQDIVDAVAITALRA
ncbi:MAG: phosphate acetyltransferase [Candidatus Omnitrophica bacterium]|nr:phosphate acetyltransferase [Candidatus Omnitrophota bacterium]